MNIHLFYFLANRKQQSFMKKKASQSNVV